MNSIPPSLPSEDSGPSVVNHGLPYRILVVDDHPLVRAGLVSVLAASGVFTVVGQAGSGPEAIETCRTLDPEIVLLDIRMPGGSGLGACRWIKAHQRRVKVVFLTSYADDECLVDAISAGADGYVLKSIEGSDLVGSLLKVAQGGSFVDPAVTQRLFARVSGVREGAGGAGLGGIVGLGGGALGEFSVVEVQILDLVARGKLNKEIAAELGVADKSLRNRLTKLFARLGASNRTQAADLWRRKKQEEWKLPPPGAGGEGLRERGA